MHGIKDAEAKLPVDSGVAEAAEDKEQVCIVYFCALVLLYLVGL